MKKIDHNAHSVYLTCSERNFGKEAFWSQSFCLLTAGGAPVEVIRQYIETQGEKKY